MMTQEEHSRYHRQTGHTFSAGWNADPLFQEARHAGIARSVATPKRQEQMVRVGRQNITRYMQEHPDHFKEATAGNGERGGPYLRKFNTSPRVCRYCAHVAKNPASLRWHVARAHGPVVMEANHRVLAVAPASERSDVYCLQVDRYHNFALAAGVFVHNCGMAAVRLSLSADLLPDSLRPVRDVIENAVPVGFASHPAPPKRKPRCYRICRYVYPTYLPGRRY